MAPYENAVESDRMAFDVRKSSNDTREYKYLVLSNQLRLLLISDSETEKSAASVNVHVGHINDPDDVPGIAHFCEHMLFLGTKKYPVEGAFDKFISKHGGMENASTAAEFTNYYFDVKAEMLFTAMDMFVQFFISPLFNADATDRELHAIDSEHQKNLLSDSRRMYYINKITSKNGHAYRKFGTGNLETLKTIPENRNIDIREVLLNFHAKYYSSNIMTVAVLGKETIGELEEIMVPLFEEVPNKHLVLSPPWEVPYEVNQLGILIKIPTVKDMKQLQLRFTLPDLHEHYKCNPADLVARLIGHEGPGSLLSLLKRKLWVNSLSCGAYNVIRGFDFFDIDMELTANGLGEMWNIVTVCFQYIQMLKVEGSHHHRLFKEMSVLEEIKFRFKGKEDPMDYVEWVTKNMHLFPPQDILRGPYGAEQFEPGLVRLILNHLIPSNLRCTVQSQDFEGETDQVSAYYNAGYSVERISPKLIEKMSLVVPHPELHLPEENLFIPKNLDVVVPKVFPHIVPFLIKDDNMMRVWYKADDTFYNPKAVLIVSVISPYVCLTPSNVNHLKMFIRLLDDKLAEFSYNAELAGVSYEILPTSCGFSINISGFNDKQVVLLRTILGHVVKLDIQETRFAVNKVEYEESLKNIPMQEPYKQVGGMRKHFLKHRTWKAEDKLQQLPGLTTKSLKHFVDEMLMKSFYIECMFCGNILLEKVRDISSVVQNVLIGDRKIVPLLPSQHAVVNSREYQLQKNTTYLYETRSKIHSNSCVVTYLQVGRKKLRTKVLCDLFAQMTSSAFYNLLRTQEQLGYIVYTGVSMSASVVGIMSLVQSHKSPKFVLEKMNSFFESFGETLSSMTDEQFLEYVEGAALAKVEKPKQLEAEVEQYWEEILMKQYNFRRHEREVAELRSLKKQDVIDFYNKFISLSSVERRKAVFVVLGKDAVSVVEDSDKSFHVVKDVFKVQSSLPMFSHLMPYGGIPLVSSSS